MKDCYYRINGDWHLGTLIGEQEIGIFKRKKYLVEVTINNLLIGTYKEKRLFDKKDVIIV